MQKNKLPQILFYQVQTPAQKLERIATIAIDHFDRKDPLLFLTENPAATKYIDTYLWNFAKESFLPHGAANDTIQISDRHTNLSKGAIFNLTREPLISLSAPIKTIYEFEDLTSPEKSALFQPKYKAYSQRAHPIVAL